MLSVTLQGIATTNESPSLSPAEYLEALTKWIQKRRIQAHDSALGGVARASTDNGILLFAPDDQKTYRRYLLEAGFSAAQVEDTIFSPQSMPGGTQWQRSGLELYQHHILSIGKSAIQAVKDMTPDPGVVGLSAEGVPIGMADLPTCNAGAGYVPYGWRLCPP